MASPVSMRTLDEAGRCVPEGDPPEAISTLEPIPSADDIEDDATIGKAPIISAADHGGEEDGGGRRRGWGWGWTDQ